jgi:hypothetical protein
MGGKSTGAAVTGPDNNKRLALLEAGVSALAMTLAANGVTVPEDGDIFAEATKAIKQGADLGGQLIALIGASTSVIARFAPDMELAPTDENESLMACQTRLLSQLAGAETPCDRRIHELEAIIAAGPTNATEGEIAAIARAETAEKRVGELETEVAELTTDVEDAISEKNRLANLLSEAGTSTAAAPVDQAPEAAPEPVERERPEAARDVGPTFSELAADDIAAAIAGGARFEVVFSNGEFEIVDFQPIDIGGEDLLRATNRQFSVIPPIHIKAGQDDTIDGAGLLLEGVQVGYCQFDPPIKVQQGQERKFDRALIFGR